MSDILVRGMDPQDVKRLKARAKRNGRSLQSEAKFVLQNSVRQASPEEMRAMFKRWDKLLKGRKFSQSSVDMIREDRER